MLSGFGGLRLGVDLGTSHSVGMLAWPGGRVQSLLFDASPLLPSAVYADPDGRILVGRDAERSARLHPDRFEPHPKRRVDETTVLLGTAEYPVPQLLGSVLGQIVAEAVRVGGQPPTSVVLTHPGSWGNHRKRLLVEAAQQCRLGEVTLLPEPVAAALYFNQVLGHQVSQGNVVVVYDFGGGTFDVSVVRRLPGGGWEVVASDGLPDIGGVDLDAALVETLGGVIASRDPDVWRRLSQPVEVADRRQRQMLYADARAAKEQLSRRATAALHVPMLDDDLHITREQFEQVARPALERTVALTAQTLARTGVGRADVAGVFLVGGSSRIPLVATMLHQRLGMPPTVLEQPELVVVQGAVQAPAAPQGVSAHGLQGFPAPNGLPEPNGFPGPDGFPAANGLPAPHGFPATNGFPAPHGFPAPPPHGVVVSAPPSGLVRSQPALPPRSTWWPDDRPWWRRRATMLGVAPIILVVALLLGDYLLPDSTDGQPEDGLTALGRDNLAAFTSTELKTFAKPWLNYLRSCEHRVGGMDVANGYLDVADGDRAVEVVTCTSRDDWEVQFIAYEDMSASEDQRDLLMRSGEKTTDASLEDGGVRVDLDTRKGRLLYWDSGEKPVAGLLGVANDRIKDLDRDLIDVWKDFTW